MPTEITTPTPNAELLNRTLDHLAELPRRDWLGDADHELWDQNSWTHCFAGHALRLLGRPVDDMPSFDVRDDALAELGLTYDQGVYLFSQHRTLDELRAYVRDEVLA